MPYFAGFLERLTENYVQRSMLSEDVHFKAVFDAEMLWMPCVSVSRVLCRGRVHSARRGPTAAALSVMAYIHLLTVVEGKMVSPGCVWHPSDIVCVSCTFVSIFAQKSVWKAIHRG